MYAAKSLRELTRQRHAPRLAANRPKVGFSTSGTLLNLIPFHIHPVQLLPPEELDDLFNSIILDSALDVQNQMGDSVIETSDSPPPPSYKISQHEFDNKTKRILEQSAAEPPRPRVDEDGFEIWDDAVFEAYALQDDIRSLSIKDSISSGSDREPSGLQPRTSNDFSRTHERGSTSSFTKAQVDARTPPAPRADPNAAGPISSQTRALDATRRRSEKQRFSLRSTASHRTNSANTPSSEPQASGSSSSSVGRQGDLHVHPAAS
ncbi:hypothetical protein NUW54_g4290 [Trametes sanguinea]|uniref:Uncharacterized protein n=1 Tax=Trametes sanguinea TaxID=158606 RepID=A0ACC1PZX6_9APHY|nr:hypothetical protein NUW54_g4290 [Trametes sanguinea]